MKTGSNRSGGNAEDLGDLEERQVEVVVEHHHCPMFDGKSPEPTLELVAIDDGAQALRRDRFIERQQT